MAEMPNALTPETIAAVAQHADKILAAVLGQPQATAPAPPAPTPPAPVQVQVPVQVETAAKAPPRRPPQNNQESECCCPRKVKFFIFGNTWINNYNAACPYVVG